MGSAEVLSLQRSAGNAAVVAVLTGVRAPREAIHRCGETPASKCPCRDCHDGSSGQEGVAVARLAEVVPIRRSADDKAPSVQPVRIHRWRLPSWDDVKGAAQAVGGAIKQGAQAVKEGVAAGIEKVAQLPGWVVGGLQSLGSKARGAASSVLSWGKDKVRNAAQGVKKLGGKLKEGIRAGITKAQAGVTKVASGAKTLGQKVGRGVGKLASKGAQAGKKLLSIGKFLGPLFNPAQMILDPGDISQVSKNIGGLATDAADPATWADFGDQLDKDVKGGLGADGQWNCDETEMLAIAGNVKKTMLNRVANMGKRLTKGTRLGKAMEFAGEMGAKLKKLAQSLGSKLAAIGRSAVDVLKNKTKPILDAAKSGIAKAKALYGKVKAHLSEWFGKKKQSFLSGLAMAKDAATKWVTDKIASLRSGIGTATDKVKSILGKLGPVLLALVPPPLLALGGIIAALLPKAIEGAQAAGKKIAELAAKAQKAAVAAATAVMDQQLKAMAQQWQIARQIASLAAEQAKKAGAAIADRVKKASAGPIGKAVAAAGAMANKFKKGAGEVVDKAAGEACAALGPIATPCADQYVPDPGPGGTRTLKMTAKGDVIIPLEAAALKIGAGASVEISREGADGEGKDGRTFEVTIEGEGELTLMEALKEEEASVSLSLPGGGSGDMGGIWSKLTAGGQSAAAAGTQAAATKAAGAAGAGAATAAGGGAASGGAGGGSVEAGVKGTVTNKYEFVMGASNCKGIGGMAALLAGLGLSGTAPAPLGNLLGMAAQHAFRESMTSCKFKTAQFASAEAELGSKGGVGALKGKLAAEVGSGIELKKGEGGAMQTTFSLFGELSGEASAELPENDLISGLGAKASAKGGFELELAFDKGAGLILPQKATASVEASFGATGFDPFVPGLTKALPSGAPGVMLAWLDFYKRQGLSEGEITAKFEYSVTNLAELSKKLMEYFEKPIEQVNTEGVLKVFGSWWNDPNTKKEPSFEASVKATKTLLGIGGKFVTGEAGAMVGAGAEVKVEEGREYKIYPRALPPATNAPAKAPALAGAGR